MLCPVCGLGLSSRCDNHGWPPSVQLGQRWRLGASASRNDARRAPEQAARIVPNVR